MSTETKHVFGASIRAQTKCIMKPGVEAKQILVVDLLPYMTAPQAEALLLPTTHDS